MPLPRMVKVLKSLSLYIVQLCGKRASGFRNVAGSHRRLPPIFENGALKITLPLCPIMLEDAVRKL